MFLLPSPPSAGAGWREGEVAPRDGEAGWREGERDGDREDGEREDEDGDGVLCGASSGRAAARATMAEDSSLESHTVTSWRVCERGLERPVEIRTRTIYFKKCTTVFTSMASLSLTSSFD